VKNVDDVIYLIEKEDVNAEENTTFLNNFGHLVLEDKGTAEFEKFLT
jgi:hypothetical protein